MANLIDDTYFIRELTIAQLGQGVTGGNGAKLTLYIDRYEPEFLKKVLGYSFYKLMLANSGDARFVSLISGSDYTYKDVLHRWEGFQNAEKISPIANYVFYMFGRQDVEQPVGSGIVRPKAENSTMVIPNLTLISAFNEMVTLVKNMNYYLKANADLYPEYKEKDTHIFYTENPFF